LDSVINQIQTLPLLSSEKPAALVSAKNQSEAPATDAGPNAESAKGRAANWWSGLAGKWQAWTHDMWGEMKMLIRVRNVEASDALMLSPDQAYFLRENLELRLLSARLALLSNNANSFRSDMKAARNIIDKYFDPAAKQTQAVLATLTQVEASNLSIEMPTLTESLSAVQNYRAKP
jgi:uroporphyrin-3 C-methyltransferase/uroporphyrinogen III methyltransferase/synthase